MPLKNSTLSNNSIFFNGSFGRTGAACATQTNHAILLISESGTGRILIIKKKVTKPKSSGSDWRDEAERLLRQIMVRFIVGSLILTLS